MEDLALCQLEKIVKNYRTLAQIPALVSAKLSSDGSVINSVWSQRNIEKGKSTKFSKAYVISDNFKLKAELSPVDVTTESLSRVSPSEKLKAVLRDVDDKQYLEIWSNYNLIRSVNLSGLEIHDKVYAEGEFASFEWSPDEKYLLYVAEKKIKKSEPFYKRKEETKKDSGSGDQVPEKGEEYLFRQDWGEQLVGKRHSILAQYDIENDKVQILEGIPDDICPARPVYSPDGSYIVGIAYRTEPRKLGLIYCTNREATIFKLDFENKYAEIPLKGVSVKAPRFTPDGKYLIWLQRSSGGPHAAAVSLVKTATPVDSSSSPMVVIDVVKKVKEISNGKQFYGLYNSGFPTRCWASNNRLILSTNQRNTINTYVVDIVTGNMTELEYADKSHIVLDVYNNIVLVDRRNLLAPDVLAIGKLPATGSEANITWTEYPTNVTLPVEGYAYKYLDLMQPTSDDVNNFSAIYIGPEKAAEKSTPLVVWPHGGPHSAFTCNLFLEGSLFASLGYAMLLINYRGSIGAGQDSVEFLLGKIGSSDVSDCILATDTALKQFPCLDPNRLVLVGGSHGGFLVTHLSGQYPDKFKAVVARNPVIDVASMSIISDIPDWCYVEAGYEYTQKGKPDEEMLLKMRKASPIEHAHKVKAPTLLHIGSKDLRVPPHQGTEYYHRLKANGITVRMNLYDDNHPLGAVPNEMDQMINAVLWIQKYCSDQQ